jgi:hypothetical protein
VYLNIVFVEDSTHSIISFFFFGGLSIPVSQAILAHLFSYNMTWAATKKEVERSNFWKEIPAILKRFRVSLIIATLVIIGMIICATPIIPYEWRVPGSGWAVIFPLATVMACHILFPVCLFVSDLSWIKAYGELVDCPQPVVDGVLVLSVPLL